MVSHSDCEECCNYIHKRTRACREEGRVAGWHDDVDVSSGRCWVPHPVLVASAPKLASTCLSSSEQSAWEGKTGILSLSCFVVDPG